MGNKKERINTKTLQKGEKSSRWGKTMKHRQSDEYERQHHSDTYFITRPDFPDKSLNMQSSGAFTPMTDRTPRAKQNQEIQRGACIGASADGIILTYARRQIIHPEFV